MKQETFYSNGKLLITGEYVVLDGAVSLAIPTRYGQSLLTEPILEKNIIWKSYDEQARIWFETKFFIDDIESECSKKANELEVKLHKILNSSKKLNPKFLSSNYGFKITTTLDFRKDWGLGTSSTLINNIAQWANIDAYQLLEMTFGGSGYDIACAQNNAPITYQLQNGIPKVTTVNFKPPFKNNLYFVYLNKKQNSREGIAQYTSNKPYSLAIINEINDITAAIISCELLSNFETLITNHERIISKLIKQTPVKDLLFNDFKGSIKSLGAWGGDFILVASEINPESYFKNKGFNTVIPYPDMILKN